MFPIRLFVVSCPAKLSENRIEAISSCVSALRVLVVDREQGAREVVAGVVDLLRDELAQVVAVRRHVLGVMHLLLGGGSSPGETGAVAAPFLELSASPLAARP